MPYPSAVTASWCQYPSFTSAVHLLFPDDCNSCTGRADRASYHNPPACDSAEAFYGFLLDAQGRPSRVFTRMSDALFFYLDEHCDVPTLRGTGAIEPAKLVWMMLKLKYTETAACLADHCRSYYDLGRIPYRIIDVGGTDNMPVLDRQGWLRMHVFDARADPAQAHRDWARLIAILNLRDPTTLRPFPTPLPRSCFPMFRVAHLSCAVHNWKLQVVRSNILAQADRKLERPNTVAPAPNQAIVPQERTNLLGLQDDTGEPLFSGARHSTLQYCAFRLLRKMVAGLHQRTHLTLQISDL